MKKIRYLVLFIFLLVIFSIDGYALVKPISEFYVNDYADILSEEVENYIIDKSKSLNNVMELRLWLLLF